MQVIHHGAKDSVTGSCHEFRAAGMAILIDCGLFQGKDARPSEVDFPVKQIDALVLTHAHIDHIGRIPWLLAAGFSGPIYCTEATAELVPLMLEDGLRLQLGLNHKQRHQILDVVKRRLKPIRYGEWIRLTPKVNKADRIERSASSVLAHYLYLRFNPAGHILGSAYLEFKLPNGEVVVFSGDLGPSNTPLLPDPVSPPRADHLYIETTYGDKLHDSVEERGKRLKAIIERSLQDGGAILIPAFSVGRTQELSFDLEQLIFQHDIKTDMPIILDSPLAKRVTQSYRRFKKLWGREAKRKLQAHRHPLAFEQCITIEDHRQHQALVNRLASTGEPAIVVAASGMCQGGRIMAYLQALLPDERTDLLFAGYQAHGTLGREIQSGSKVVQIEQARVEVRAQIHTMSGYSAHADQADLLRFITGIAEKPKQVHLIHGEAAAKQAFAAELTRRGYSVF